MDGSSDSVESPHFLCPESYSYGSISSPTFSIFTDDRLVSNCHVSCSPPEEICVPENTQGLELVYHRDEM
jgi:hypothetical protein